jgi:hypothetical protein
MRNSTGEIAICILHVLILREMNFDVENYFKNILLKWSHNTLSSIRFSWSWNNRRKLVSNQATLTWILNYISSIRPKYRRSWRWLGMKSFLSNLQCRSLWENRLRIILFYGTNLAEIFFRNFINFPINLLYEIPDHTLYIFSSLNEYGVSWAHFVKPTCYIESSDVISQIVAQ